MFRALIRRFKRSTQDRGSRPTTGSLPGARGLPRDYAALRTLFVVVPFHEVGVPPLADALDNAKVFRTVIEYLLTRLRLRPTSDSGVRAAECAAV